MTHTYQKRPLPWAEARKRNSLELLKNDKEVAERLQESEARFLAEEEHAPCLTLAEVWYDHGRYDTYAAYLQEFYVRHPIWWFLFYRWWFFSVVEPEAFAVIIRLMRISRLPRYSSPTLYPYPSRRAAYAMIAPGRFLIWLLFSELQQFSVKVLSRVRKMVFRFNMQSDR